ncbi:MAG: phytanoyl-CoA dioxygenase family protein [Acidobacteria bacterium]|nr:phytanoyl-CoA dioxygenase family protein [Acidobacteriota bacterium]
MPTNAAQKDLWLYELRLHGFVILPGFLPIDLIDAMHEQFEPIYRGELARLQAGDMSSLRGRNRVSFDIQLYIEKLRGPLDDDRFRRNPVIEELVDAVLGKWRYGVTKAECPFQDADTMAWHPDVPNDRPGDPLDPVRPMRVTFNVPLVDVTDSNGPMEIIPGSHRMHHYGIQDFIYRLPRVHSVKVLMNRGDAMLRDGNALHRGTPNLTDRPRILLDQTYRALDD